MKDLVSIIMPVYNVENYLKTCIDSVLKQTYENIELIIVDDGSTDSSGAICDSYSQIDNVCVLHKKNGGLSSARNYGIPHAKGEYLSFIDSDDYIDKDFIKNLIDAAKKNNCDISMCAYTREENSFSGILSESVVSSETVLKNIILQNNQELYSVAAWNKLYKRNIFSDIEYPVGKLNEDMFVICEILSKTEKIAVLDYKGYFYRINQSSITQKKFQHKNMDVIEACDHIIDYIDKNKSAAEDLKSAAINLKFRRSFQMLYKLWLSNTESEDDEKILYDYIKSNRKVILSCKESKKSSKLLAVLLILNKPLFKKAVLMYYGSGGAV